MTRESIQQALDTIYAKVFNLGQADLYPGLVSGPYIQHNPLFPNGLDAIVGYIKQAGRIPCEVKRVAIDGDLAFVHVRYLDWAGQETAGVDIFRFNSDGKVVEHWDVLQPVCQPPRTMPTRCSRRFARFAQTLTVSEATIARRPRFFVDQPEFMKRASCYGTLKIESFLLGGI
jgi:predicted SnoaL-like aldol condensation-catalyzing enzyme